MADVLVTAAFQLNTGEIVDCSTTMTEGTASELLLSTAYSVSAVSVGTYAEGKVITQIIQAPSSPNLTSWAYVNRRGSILCVLPVSVDGVASQPCPMPFQFTLQAGDTIQVMCNASDDREFAYSCITNVGVHAIFSGTPADNTGSQLTHILSGQGLGASLTNQRIVTHWATSVDGPLLISGSGVFILNDRGLPIGGTVATNPINLQPKGNSMGTCGIGLNFVAQVSTTA